MRIDKFLWCVRITKTRTLATDLCNADKIKINSATIKPSKELKINDIIAFKQPPIWRTYKVLAFPKSRIGAVLVAQYCQEITTPDDLAQLNELEEMKRVNKSLGLVGRPTKKDRRDLNQFNPLNDL